jgi:hypothetical protein
MYGRACMVDSGIQSTTFLFLDAFSNLVTTHSFGRNDWLARTGDYSIYALLSQIVPQVRNERVYLNV